MAAGDLPLVGQRVVVTRPAERGMLATLLRMQGAEVVELPLIGIADPDDGGAALASALDDLAGYDWLVVTSPAGAQRVAAAVAAAAPGSPHLAAVGTATGEALGRAPDLVPSRQIAESLVDAFPHGHGKVLLARAAEARSVVPIGLRSKGWQVDDVVAYRTVILDYGPLPAEAASADSVVFASGSQVRAWAHNFGATTPPNAVAIGPATAAVAAEVGIAITAVAQHHSLSGLVETVIATRARQTE
jgi:uroporphyrinogen-III synthase